MKSISILAAVLASAIGCVLLCSPSVTAFVVIGPEAEPLAEPADDQMRIDKILEAYRRLPASEIVRLGLDPKERVSAGSPEAELLFQTWQKRVEEIRAVMNSVAKPVTIMEDIILIIKEKSSTFGGDVTAEDTAVAAAAILPALAELESLVSDVDNAKDFHTIGGWVILSSLLSARYPNEIRAAAAWAVGTAVKNSYDYQLWAIEPFEDMYQLGSEISANGDLIPVSAHYNASTLQYLTDILLDDSIEMGLPLRLKALYAFAAAVRGNPDVQGAAMAEEISLLQTLQRQLYFATPILNITRDNQADITRFVLKVWGLLHDLVEERRYLHVELAHSDVTNELRQQMLSLRLLGDDLMSEGFIKLAFHSFEIISSYLQDSIIHMPPNVTNQEPDFHRACESFTGIESVEIVDLNNDADTFVRSDASGRDVAKIRILENILGFINSHLKQLSNAQKANLKSKIGANTFVNYHLRLSQIATLWCKLTNAADYRTMIVLVSEILETIVPFSE